MLCIAPKKSILLNKVIKLEKFRTLVYDYFDNLSYAERKSYENMTDFDDMVERSSRVICNIMDL